MDVNFTELQKKVAAEHGVILSDNDPLLLYVTINEYLLNQYKDSLNDTLSDLSDILINIKDDVNNYIKEKELLMLQKVQQVNNKNVENVNNKIKEYFQQEAENNNKINNNINNIYKYLYISIMLNFLLLLLYFIK